MASGEDVRVGGRLGSAIVDFCGRMEPGFLYGFNVRAKSIDIWYFAAFLVFTVISGLVFLYTSFALSFGNVFVLLFVSWLLSMPKGRLYAIKYIFVFIAAFAILSGLEILLGGGSGHGFGSGCCGQPYETHMTDGGYTNAGKVRVLKLFGYGTLVYFLGDLCLRVGLYDRNYSSNNSGL